MNSYIPNLQDITFAVPFSPPKLFKGWKGDVVEDGAAVACFTHKSGLVVFASLDELDVAGEAKKWIHLSCSRRARLPSWDDLKGVKKMFLGDDKEAVQVFPRARDYVNLHPYCLHLWSPFPE